MKLIKNDNKNIVDIFDFVISEKKFDKFISIPKMIKFLKEEFIDRLKLTTKDSASKYIDSIKNFNFFCEENYELEKNESEESSYGDKNNLNSFKELLEQIIRKNFDIEILLKSIESKPKTTSLIRGYPEEDVRLMAHYVECNKIRNQNELHSNMESYYRKREIEHKQLEKYVSGKCLHANTSYTKNGDVECHDCGTIIRNTF